MRKWIARMNVDWYLKTIRPGENRFETRIIQKNISGTAQKHGSHKPVLLDGAFQLFSRSVWLLPW